MDDEGVQTGDEPDAESALRDRIAQRAYEISEGEESGSPEENWQRAEQEVRAQSE